MQTNDKKQTILMVDDTPSNIALIADSLRDEYQIKVATGGDEALQLLNRFEIDLILLDVTMQDIDGYEVCRRLKKMPGKKDIPIIFVTANSDAGNEEYGLNLGAVDYIIKPFHLAIARARIKNHLELRQKSKLLESLSIERNRIVAEGAASLEQERLTISRDLHDTMGAFFTQLTLRFSEIVKMCDARRYDEIVKICESGKKMVVEAHSEISRTVSDLRPDVLSVIGLSGAVIDLIDGWQKAAPNVEFTYQIDSSLDKVDARKSGILFRLAQEALTNAMRHTLPTALEVSFRNVNGKVELIVYSKGKILNRNSKNNIVPKTLNERTTLLGGEMKFECNIQDEYSKVVIDIPL